jgi:hypothetical protein
VEKKMKKLSSVCLVAIALTMGCAVNAKNINSNQSYYWYDGDRQVEVHLDETLIADFNRGSDVAAKAATDSNLSAGKKISGAQLWKVTPGSSSGLALKSVKSQDQSGAYSPVFRESQTSGAMRALPGGVVVQFPPDWDESRISQWVSDQGQSIESKAEFGTNFYIIASPSGLASLEIANGLYETGDVLLASPNWWRERYAK